MSVGTITPTTTIQNGKKLYMEIMQNGKKLYMEIIAVADQNKSIKNQQLSQRNQ